MAARLRAQRHTELERVVARLQDKHGYASVRRGIMLLDPALGLDAMRDHVVHPVGFLGTVGNG